MQRRNELYLAEIVEAADAIRLFLARLGGGLPMLTDRTRAPERRREISVFLA